MSGTKKIPNTQTTAQMTVGKAQARHVPAAELHAREPGGLGLGLSEFEELACEIDRDYLTLGADGLGRGQRGGAGATAHVKDARPVTQPQPLDGPPAIPRPER